VIGLAIVVALTTISRSTSGESYDEAISYTRTRPAFTPTRTVDVSNASELQTAISNLEAGDLVQATASFRVTGETVIKSRLSSPAELDFTGVSFVYSGGLNLPAVWLDNAANLRIFGGDASTADTGGDCILAYGSQHVLWWGFAAHDCGGSGISDLTVKTPAEYNDFQGEIWKVGQNLAWDPHPEKGTGEYCAGEFGDNGGGYAFDHNRLAFYCHDIPVGAAVALGFSGTPSAASGNVLYLKAEHLTDVATRQTGGNALELWGNTSPLGLDVKYLTVDDAEGYGVFGGGVYSDQSLSGVTIDYGRASHTNLNPRYAGRSSWDSAHGVVYHDVQSSP
jgi:hypothetical protein